MPESSPPPAVPRARQDPLLRLLFWNGISGAVIALAVVGAVLATDVAHLRTLIAQADEPWMPILLLVFGFTVTLCSVSMATAIMALGREPGSGNGTGPRGGTPAKSGILVPVPARATR